MSAGTDEAARKEWARKWFEGEPSCPLCGGTDIDCTGTDSQDNTQFELWTCRACEHDWRGFIVLECSSMCADEDDSGDVAAWIDDPYASRENCKALADALRDAVAQEIGNNCADGGEMPWMTKARDVLARLDP